ncbi:MAG: hypothetical protein L6367_00365 [Cellulomonas sp.]|nr:hypothetical protein [Cellulomonas sp.]
MRFRSVVAVAAGAAIGLVGLATPASAYSAYDSVTVSSMNTLVTAMESYAMFDGNDQYTGVSAAALSDWGWSPGSSTAVQIVIEGDGGSWWAVGQDTHSGAREYTFTSATAVNGVLAGSVAVSAPQPSLAASTAGVKIRDVGEQVDIDQLALALAGGGVAVQDLCDASVFVAGTHQAGSSVSDQTLACQTAAAAGGATLRSVLAAMLKAGGGAVLATIALEFVGDGTQTASTPAWVDNGQGPDSQRPVPTTLPDTVWKITRAATRFAALAQVDDETARTAARQCLAYVANAFSGVDPYDECSNTPIFLPGQSDTPEATQHDIEALASWPAWVQLNYRPGAANPSSEGWKNSSPICAAKAAGQDCDEFPFYATQQGGGLAVPTPSLKAVNSVQNQLQGTRYRSFLADCHISDGDAFLVVPVPASAPTVPTLRVCNGH